MSALAAPQKLGPTRAEKLGRSLYPDADGVAYLNRRGRGEMIIVTEANLIRIVDYRDLDSSR